MDLRDSAHRNLQLPSSSSPSMSHLNTPDPTAPLSDSLDYLSLSSSPVPLLSPHGDGSRPLSRSAAVSHQPAPRRTPSSTSLRDERRKSTPGLTKRSSTASLRSVRNGGRSTSPRPSLPPSTSTSITQRSSNCNRSLSPREKTNMFSRSSRSATAEHPTITAASIAADHFQKEVDLHQSLDLQSKTLVVLHDACYGHRFSRPRTSKAALSTIVERPERIRASALGVSAAYVRLGRRHAGERFAPHPDLDPHLLPVPFQIRRTARTMPLNSPAVTNVHGGKWMEDLKSMCDAAESRLALNGMELVRPRSVDKDDSAANAPQFHEGDLYLCSESLNAFEGALGGVCEGIDAVFGPGSTKRAFVCIRPPGHHCSSGHPSGFCWINNVHVGISYAAMTHGLTHAAILDFDLHHGDGSQEIAWEQNRKAVTAHWNSASYKKTMIGYFSLHDINSYPCETGDPDKVRNASICIDRAHGQSIWNIHLEPWKTVSEFWELYKTKYAVLLEKARSFLRFHTERLSNAPNGPPPKAAIFISAGFDASEWEGAGMQRHKVNVPTEFYAKFTADVVRMAEEEGLGVDGRVISVLEGGYSDRALTSGVFSHLAGLGDVSNSDAYGPEGQQSSRLASEMTDRLGLHAADAGDGNHTLPAGFRTEWWDPALLDELEALVYPQQSPTIKPREKTGPTYFAPTRSFTAKVVTPPRDRKSTSSRGISEPGSPPPLPDVGWATAADELSKILIPSQRQTTSHQPVELNAEASRLRRERQMAADNAEAAAAPEEKRMQLRSRKPRTSQPNTPKKDITKPKGNRRTTIDVAGPTQGLSVDKSPGTRARRRESTASTPANDAGQETLTRRSSVGGNQVVSRPGTALSTRSSASTAVRKNSTTRTVNSKPSTSPKRAPPVPKLPPTFQCSAPSKKGERSAAAPHGNEKGLLPGKESTGNHDLDNLTAGVQKLSIKLNLPSPEENAAREKERKRLAEEHKRATSKVVSRPSTKQSGVKGSRSSGSKSVPATSASRSTQVPVSAASDVGMEIGEKVKQEQESVVPVSSPPAPSNENSEVHAVAENLSDNSVTPQASSVSPVFTPGDAHDATPAQSTVYSPPTSTLQTHHGISISTSSSPIPFAPCK